MANTAPAAKLRWTSGRGAARHDLVLPHTHRVREQKLRRCRGATTGSTNTGHASGHISWIMDHVDILRYASTPRHLTGTVGRAVTPCFCPQERLLRACDGLAYRSGASHRGPGGLSRSAHDRRSWGTPAATGRAITPTSETRAGESSKRPGDTRRK